MKFNTIEEVEKFSHDFWEQNPAPFKHNIFGFAIGKVFEDQTGFPIAVRWLTMNAFEKSKISLAIILTVLKKKPEDIKGLFIHRLTEDEAKEMISMFDPYKETGTNHFNKKHKNVLALKTRTGHQGENICIAIMESQEYMQNEPVTDMFDVHFRLGVISYRLCRPAELRVPPKEIMPRLRNLAWYAGGVMTIDEWNENPFRTEVLLCQSKLPPYVWAMPLNESVRIENPFMVRFGSYIGDNTIVMHYGFMNYNSGIEEGMVEGRIPQGVMLGKGVDLGAASGSLGTMSGGNSVVISIGNDCLIETNAEVGIPLGNNCRVCMNTCFHGNTPVYEILEDGGERKCKASEFANIDNITIRTNSTNGRIEVLHQPNKVELNAVLHQNTTETKKVSN